MAWEHAQRAHDASQNSPLLHARAHLARTLGWTLRGRPGAAVRELPLAMMALPAALVRRGAGLQPGSAGGRGLLATWRMRRDPPSLKDPLTRPVRVSDEGS
ncbi:MAG: DUF3703 domain-containing protein [Oligoflexia bacterium]|nr:DUF3703 domain-containing protein [Oligoflexia bacterium]